MKKYERLTESYSGKSVSIEKKVISENVPMHWHEFYEIEFIKSGKCTFLVNGKRHSGNSGDMFIFNPSDFHEIYLDSPSLELYTLHFNLGYISDSLLSNIIHSENKKVNFEKEFFNDEIFLFELLLKENSKNLKFQSEYLKNILNAIIVNVCRQLEKFSPSEKPILKNPINLAINYIQLNFQEDITLDDIAKYANCSSSYISRIFHEYMGITIKGYIKKLRLEYAAKMLEFSKASVTDICYMSGFGDFSNFWRAFFDKYKCSPRNYRNLKKD